MDNFNINDAVQAKMINTFKTAKHNLLYTNAMI